MHNLKQQRNAKNKSKREKVIDYLMSTPLEEI